MRLRILLTAAIAAGLWASSTQAFPLCNALLPPVPSPTCKIIGSHPVCTTYTRCQMPTTQVIANYCYKWACSGGITVPPGTRSYQKK